MLCTEWFLQGRRCTQVHRLELAMNQRNPLLDLEKRLDQQNLLGANPCHGACGRVSQSEVGFRTFHSLVAGRVGNCRWVPFSTHSTATRVHVLGPERKKNKKKNERYILTHFFISAKKSTQRNAMLPLDDDKDATMLNKVGRVKGGHTVPMAVCHVTSLTLPCWHSRFLDFNVWRSSHFFERITCLQTTLATLPIRRCKR